MWVLAQISSQNDYNPSALNVLIHRAKDLNPTKDIQIFYKKFNLFWEPAPALSENELQGLISKAHKLTGDIAAYLSVKYQQTQQSATSNGRAVLNQDQPQDFAMKGKLEIDEGIRDVPIGQFPGIVFIKMLPNSSRTFSVFDPVKKERRTLKITIKKLTYQLVKRENGSGQTIEINKGTKTDQFGFDMELADDHIVIDKNLGLTNRLVSISKIDKAMNTPMAVKESSWTRGGIDLNASKFNLERQGSGVDIQFDPITIARFKQGDFDGIVPVITRITPMANIFPLLGLKEPKGQEMVAAV